MSDDPRARLRAAQEALAHAVVKAAPPPPGFDPERTRAAAAALASKRCHEVAQAWPALARALGDGYPERFAAFARRMPLPAMGGPLADGHAFARELRRERRLPDEARLALLAVELRYTRTRAGLEHRRGGAVVVDILPETGVLILALRWRGFGERWIRVPIRRRQSKT